jgi:SNF2 family DNA or RNA helicase
MRFLEQAIISQRGGAIFDEMGLGKTIQALGYLKFHPECFPVLFIVKSGVKFQFFKEMIRWLGPEYVGQVIQTSNDFIIPGLKTYFMSYDIVVPKERVIRGKKVQQGMPLEKIIAIGAKTIVMDECQQIKNPDSTRTQMIRRIVKEAQHVIPLSGTPWKNRGSEFFTVLNMLAPSKFWSYQNFLDRWVDTYMQGNTTKLGGIRRPKEFKEYIKDIAIRRERAEVMKELPIISRVKHYTEIDSTSQKAYDDEVSEFVKFYNEKVIGGEEDSFATQGPLIARLARMRHITGLSKIPATEELVDDFVEETDRKIVVFVHHQDVGQILYGNLSKKYNGTIPVLQLTGGMSPEARFNTQNEFNQAPRAIMVASTLAAGEGLNLQTCADCIMHERQWNPANEEQAEGRFIRIGQTYEHVTATYTTAAGTVDEHLDGIVERKRVDFHNGMNRGEMPMWKQTDIIKELSEKIVNDFNNKNRKTA